MAKPRFLESQGQFQRFDEVFIFDGLRTPMVDYQGAFADANPIDLGVHAARSVLARAGIDAGDVDSVISGNTASGGFDRFCVARHSGLYSGVRQAVPALNVQHICCTGFEVCRQAGEQIALGVASLTLVVGDRGPATSCCRARPVSWPATRASSTPTSAPRRKRFERKSMNIQGQSAIVTGGGSGLGEAVARELASLGARVTVIDVNTANAERVAGDIGGLACTADIADITDSASLVAALDAATAAHGTARIDMNIAGIGGQARGGQGRTAGAAGRWRTRRDADDGLGGRLRRPGRAEGQKAKGQETKRPRGQEAYSASKGGIVSMTLPLARDLAQHGIRVCTVAAGPFETPLMLKLPEAVQRSLAASIPFPSRLGRPEEFAHLATHIATHGHRNGEVIRLDGALRMSPR